MHSLKGIGRVASAGLVALAVTVFACSDVVTPPAERNATTDITVNRDVVGSGSGLVAAYGFDEASGTTTTDASGTGNTGTLGSGVTRTTSGKFGGALVFNGGYVTVPGASSLSLSGAMTVEAWVNPSTIDATWRDIIEKGNDNYYLMATTNNASRPAGGGKLSGASSTTKAFGAATLPANTWTHLAVSYDGTTVRLYVNGALVSSATGAGALTTSTNALTIGGDPFYGQFFKGAIDEIRIYNRALSATEVQADMNTAVGATPPAPADTQAPTVSIASPSTTGSYATTGSTITIGGTASDNVGVASVTWTNSAGGSGTMTGTTSWSAANIALQSGTNVITVTAQDSAKNTATATLTVTKSTTTSPTPTPSGLVAAYGFNEASGTTTADASGNGNTGSLGGGVTRITSGKFGGALSFNNSFVTVPNAPALNLTTAMTLEAWVYPTTTSNWATAVMKEQPGEFVYSLYAGAPGTPGGYFNVATSSSTEKQVNAASTLALNTWSHLATTYDGTTTRLYVNGVQVASKAFTGTIATSTGAVRIGGNTVWGEYFRGSIDEVRIYNRALSATEVQTDMNTAVGGSTSQPSTPSTPSDVTPPTVAITSPQASGTYTTTATQVTLSGTASDNIGVTQVRWTNSLGGSGTASGTTSWSSAIALKAGTNVLTVTAQDAANNTSVATLSVVSNPPVAPATATKVAITTQPSSSATSGVAFSQQPVIQLRDASNNAVAQSGVVVTAAIASGGGTLGGTTTATTNGSGVASFTNLSITGTDGARTLSFSGGSLTAATSNSISVASATAPPPSSGTCSNEPAGYTTVNDQPWDQIPIRGSQTPAGWIDDAGTGSKLWSIVSDPTSPFPSSNHNVIAGKFPAGMPGGTGPFYTYRPFSSSEQYPKLYICLFLKHDANFDNTNGNSGTKFMWPAGDQIQGTKTYTGFNAATMDFMFFQQGTVDRMLSANVNWNAASVYNRRGQWVKFEMLLKANSSDATADGGLDVWIDGVLTHHYTNVQWLMGSSRTWQSLAWNPTYGGGTNPVPHDQYQYIDNIHISGSR